MTDEIKKLEDKFNEGLPEIEQIDDLSKVDLRKFDPDAFMKAAKELQKVINANDRKELTGSQT